MRETETPAKMRRESSPALPFRALGAPVPSPHGESSVAASSQPPSSVDVEQAAPAPYPAPAAAPEQTADETTRNATSSLPHLPSPVYVAPAATVGGISSLDLQYNPGAPTTPAHACPGCLSLQTTVEALQARLSRLESATDALKQQQQVDSADFTAALENCMGENEALKTEQREFRGKLLGEKLVDLEQRLEDRLEHRSERLEAGMERLEAGLEVGLEEVADRCAGLEERVGWGLEGLGRVEGTQKGLEDVRVELKDAQVGL